MVGVAPERLRHDLFKLGLDDIDRFTWRQAGAVANAEDVSVDREGFFAKRRVQDDIGGLAANTGQRLQRFAGSRDRTSVTGDQGLA